MMPRLAVLALVVVTCNVAAPALAPVQAWASAESGSTVATPGIPWSKIWQFIKTWGPLLLTLVDELLSPSGGGGTSDPPPPPRNPGMTALSANCLVPYGRCA